MTFTKAPQELVELTLCMGNVPCETRNRIIVSAAQRLGEH